ncbi:hypothetical protein JOF36_007187 [Pseudonocardia parietis]|uniref:Uncharacterized protein n=1 Tax=Pseudonocardia parietis TaxID=570936 RepID=A0ABS4W5D4_9PSEU|nr:hypothetical protein [Pseudonocardia parietis]
MFAADLDLVADRECVEEGDRVRALQVHAAGTLLLTS